MPSPRVYCSISDSEVQIRKVKKKITTTHMITRAPVGDWAMIEARISVARSTFSECMRLKILYVCGFSDKGRSPA